MTQTVALEPPRGSPRVSATLFAEVIRMRPIKWLWRTVVSGLRSSRVESTKQPTDGAYGGGGAHAYKHKD